MVSIFCTWIRIGYVASTIYLTSAKLVTALNETSIKTVATILHDIGVVVWHNVPKLRDVVIIR